MVKRENIGKQARKKKTANRVAVSTLWAWGVMEILGRGIGRLKLGAVSLLSASAEHGKSERSSFNTFKIIWLTIKYSIRT